MHSAVNMLGIPELISAEIEFKMKTQMKKKCVTLLQSANDKSGSSLYQNAKLTPSLQYYSHDCNHIAITYVRVSKI